MATEEQKAEDYLDAIQDPKAAAREALSSIMEKVGAAKVPDSASERVKEDAVSAAEASIKESTVTPENNERSANAAARSSVEGNVSAASVAENRTDITPDQANMLARGEEIAPPKPEPTQAKEEPVMEGVAKKEEEVRSVAPEVKPEEVKEIIPETPVIEKEEKEAANDNYMLKDRIEQITEEADEVESFSEKLKAKAEKMRSELEKIETVIPKVAEASKKKAAALRAIKEAEDTLEEARRLTE